MDLNVTQKKKKKEWNNFFSTVLIFFKSINYTAFSVGQESIFVPMLYRTLKIYAL